MTVFLQTVESTAPAAGPAGQSVTSRASADRRDSEADVTRGEAGSIMTARTGTTTEASTARRASAGVIQLTGRDIDGLLLCGEHYGAPYDLLAAALQAPPGRVSAIVRRWRRAGLAAAGRLGPGPGWCWLTRDGMTATGLGYPALRPTLGRLAHIRAVLATRLWLESGPG